MSGSLERDQNLADFTTFRVGGPADLLARPADVRDLAILIQTAEHAGIPWTLLGGGANVLIADQGIEGLVILCSNLNSIELSGDVIVAQTGADISQASEFAAQNNLSGLEFIYSMPGSVGGAVWMNARCYGGEISDVLAWVDYLDVEGSGSDTALTEQRLVPGEGQFAYKVSPFQSGRKIIVSAAFRLSPGDGESSWQRMRNYQADRQAKGHFSAPCAGSVFKNNHDFGAPSGKIIDALGLRGTQIGGAAVSDQHANIIINTGTASAQDISDLISLIQQRVLNESGYALEPEVLKIGRWKH